MNQLNHFLKKYYNICDNLIELYNRIDENIKDRVINIEKVAQYNQYKVINAMQKNNLNETHFNATTGYGYNDIGRDVLDKIYADIFGAEDALVRHNFISGTHAISTVLSGLLRPGDTLVAVTGKPYDTLDEIIGARESSGSGSLKEFGINYKQVDLLANGNIDLIKLQSVIDEKVKVALIQRSCGYAWRPSFDIEQIREIIKFIKDINPNVICMIDNNYGEFAEELEPTNVGADICTGSLIKNAGGGIAQTGGYVVGSSKSIEKIANRLFFPGVGKECGATLGFNKSMIQGLFMAPHIVGESIKGAVFAANLFEELGFDVSPKFETKRTDIIQAIKFHDKDKLIAFCQGIQKASPVDSYVLPMPWDMPGYSDQVIMAAGTFVQGASIELSSDAPIRPPYIAYMQGGLTAAHVKLGVLVAVQEMANKGLIAL